MKKVFVAGALAAALVLGVGAAGSSASACGGYTDDAASFGKMSVEQVWARVEAKDDVHIYDANSKERYDQGHVPGAVWVDYKALTAEALPAEKSDTVVFYCAREQCKASHKAAEAAVVLGYTSVYIMPEGIMGWEAKNKPVQRVEAPRADAKRES